jgi:hypothetical protein
MVGKILPRLGMIVQDSKEQNWRETMPHMDRLTGSLKGVGLFSRRTFSFFLL